MTKAPDTHSATAFLLPTPNSSTHLAVFLDLVVSSKVSGCPQFCIPNFPSGLS